MKALVLRQRLLLFSSIAERSLHLREPIPRHFIVCVQSDCRSQLRQSLLIILLANHGARHSNVSFFEVRIMLQGHTEILLGLFEATSLAVHLSNFVCGVGTRG